MKPKRDMTLEELLDLSRNVWIMNYPYLAPLLVLLPFKEATGKWCTTAATDGKYVYYNRDFFNKLSPKEINWVYGHELEHIVRDLAVLSPLGTRRAGRNAEDWNKAQDFIINYSLEHDEGYKKMPLQMPSIKGMQFCYDPEITNELSTEEVYNLIQQKQEKYKDFSQFDDHMEYEANITVQGNSGRPNMTEAERAEIRQQIEDALRQSVLMAQSAGDGAGNLPGFMVRAVEALSQHKLSWRQLLRNFGSGMEPGGEPTYSRLRRRTYTINYAMNNNRMDFENIKILFPKDGEIPVPFLSVAIDTSGSMTDQMCSDFMSEIYGIACEYETINILVIPFDGNVTNVKLFTEENREEMHEYKPEGGGGTNFESVFNYMKEKEVVPDRLIFFTDGYPCSTWGDPTYCDTLFICYGKDSPISPFGMTVQYDPDQ